MTQSNRTKLLSAALGLAVACFFIFLSLRALDWAVVGNAFRNANLVVALLGVPLIVTAYAVRLERWRLMLRAVGSRATRRNLFAPFLGSFALNNILPMRLGDVARATAFRKQIGVSISASTASLLVERVFDLYALLLLGALALIALPNLQDASLSATLLPLSGALFAILFALTILLFFPRFIARIGLWMKASPMGRFLPGGLVRFGIRTMVRISHIVKRAGTLPIIAMSLVAWVLEGAVMLCALMSLKAVVAPAAAWLGLVAGNLGTLLPGTPGHFGTFHYVFAKALSFVGTEFSIALLAATIGHLIIWLVVSISGLTALTIDRSWQSIFGPRKASPPALRFAPSVSESQEN